MNETSAGVRHLAEAEMWNLLREAVVGRVAVLVDGRPDIFPVNHVVDHGTVVFRTAPGTKMSAATNQIVAFEVDGFDPSTGDAWSVVLKGTARESKTLYDVLDAVELPLQPWQAGHKPHFLRIAPDDISGRRFRADRSES